MAKMIKVRCNGPARHVNEIDLDKALRRDVVLRGRPGEGGPRVPERLVLPCRFCTGQVIIRRAMIEEEL